VTAPPFLSLMFVFNSTAALLTPSLSGYAMTRHVTTTSEASKVSPESFCLLLFFNWHVPVPFLFDDWFVHACEDGVCAHFVLICWVSGSTFRALTPTQIQQLHFTGRGGNLVEFKGVGGMANKRESKGAVNAT